MNNFIKQVRQYPYLWDANHVSYRDLEHKDSAWEAIAKKCGIVNGTEAKLQWKKLRDSHREAMRRRKTLTGQAAQHIRPWKYEELMSFLTPQTFHNSAASNVCNFAESEPLSTESLLSAADTPASFSSPTRSPPPSSESPRSVSMTYSRTKVVKNQNKAFVTNMTDLVKDRNTQREQKKHTTRAEREIERNSMRQTLWDMNRASQDALSNLFTSFCQKTRQLPKFLQLRVEREVFEIVSRAEEEALNLNSTHNSLSPTSATYEYIDDASYYNSPLPDPDDNKLSTQSYNSLFDVSPQPTKTTSDEPQGKNDS